MQNEPSNSVITKKELATLLKVSIRTIERRLDSMQADESIVFERYRPFRIGRLWRFEVVERKLTSDSKAA